MLAAFCVFFFWWLINWSLWHILLCSCCCGSLAHNHHTFVADIIIEILKIDAFSSAFPTVTMYCILGWCKVTRWKCVFGLWLLKAPDHNKYSVLDRDTFEWTTAVAWQGPTTDGLSSWPVYKHVVGLLMVQLVCEIFYYSPSSDCQKWRYQMVICRDNICFGP